MTLQEIRVRIKADDSEAQSAFKRTSQGSKKLVSDFRELEEQTKQNEDATRRYQQMAETLTRSTLLAGKASQEAATRYETERGALKNLTQAEKDHIIALAKAKDAAEKALDSKQRIGSYFDELPRKAQNVGRNLTLGVSTPLILLGRQAIGVAADFERSMNVLQVNSHASAEEMEALKKKATELGADLSLPATSAKDAGDAMLELVKGGLSVVDTMSAAKGVLQLSAAAQIENADAAKITANALNAFHLSGAQAVHVADLLAGAAASSTGEVSDMAAALQQSAAVMSNAHVSIDDTVAAISQLAQAGIQGQDAGTSLKQMMLSLEGPSSTARKTMKALGIEIYDASGKMKPFGAIIQTFADKTNGLTQKQKDFALATIFGSDAVRAANVLIRDGVDGHERLLKAVSSSGSAAEQAAAQNKGLMGALDGLNSAIETIENSAMTPYLKELAKDAKLVADQFNSLSPEMQAMVVKSAALATVVGPVIWGIGSLTGTLKGTVTVSKLVVSGLKSASGWVKTLGDSGLTATTGVVALNAAEGTLGSTSVVAAGQLDAVAASEAAVGNNAAIAAGKVSGLARALSSALSLVESAGPLLMAGTFLTLVEENLKYGGTATGTLKPFASPKTNQQVANEKAASGYVGPESPNWTKKRYQYNPDLGWFGNFSDKELDDARRRKQGLPPRKSVASMTSGLQSSVMFDKLVGTQVIDKGIPQGPATPPKEHTRAAMDAYKAAEEARSAKEQAAKENAALAAQMAGGGGGKSSKQSEADKQLQTVKSLIDGYKEEAFVLQHSGESADVARLKYRLLFGDLTLVSGALKKSALDHLMEQEALKKEAAFAEATRSSIQGYHLAVLKASAATDQDKIAIERFGKSYSQLSSATHRAMVDQEVAAKKQADAAEATQKHAEFLSQATQATQLLGDETRKAAIEAEGGISIWQRLTQAQQAMALESVRLQMAVENADSFTKSLKDNLQSTIDGYKSASQRAEEYSDKLLIVATSSLLATGDMVSFMKVLKQISDMQDAAKATDRQEFSGLTKSLLGDLLPQIAELKAKLGGTFDPARAELQAFVRENQTALRRLSLLGGFYGQAVATSIIAVKSQQIDLTKSWSEQSKVIQQNTDLLKRRAELLADTALDKWLVQFQEANNAGTRLKDLAPEIRDQLKGIFDRSVLTDYQAKVKELEGDLRHLGMTQEQIERERLKDAGYNPFQIEDVISLEKSIEKERKALEFAKDVKRDLVGIWKDAFEEGPNHFFTATLKGIVDLTRNILNERIAERLANIVANPFIKLLGEDGEGATSADWRRRDHGGLLGGIFSPGAPGAVGTPPFFPKYGNAEGPNWDPFGGILGNLFKFRAEGGDIFPGTRYIVGEHGPEAFLPRTSGRVVSNDDLAEALGNGGTSSKQHVTIEHHWHIGQNADVDYVKRNASAIAARVTHAGLQNLKRNGR